MEFRGVQRVVCSLGSFDFFLPFGNIYKTIWMHKGANGMVSKDLAGGSQPFG